MDKDKKSNIKFWICVICALLFSLSVVVSIVYGIKTLIFAFSNPSCTGTQVLLHMIRYTAADKWVCVLIISYITMMWTNDN